MQGPPSQTLETRSVGHAFGPLAQADSSKRSLVSLNGSTRTKFQISTTCQWSATSQRRTSAFTRCRRKSALSLLRMPTMPVQLSNWKTRMFELISVSMDKLTFRTTIPQRRSPKNSLTMVSSIIPLAVAYKMIPNKRPLQATNCDEPFPSCRGQLEITQ